jgi:thioredoxin 1
MAQYASYKNLSNKKQHNEYSVMHIQNKDHRTQLIRENGILCIDVFANWCEPCMQLMPKYTELSQKYAGNALLVKEELNNNLTNEFELTQIPTILIFVKGHLYKKMEGFTPEELTTELDSLISGFQAPPEQFNVSATTGKTYNSASNPYYRQNYGQ